MDPMKYGTKGNTVMPTSKGLARLLDTLRNGGIKDRREASERLLTLAYFYSTELVESGIHTVLVEMLQDPDDYILYHKKSGALYYDENGSDPGGRVQFAQLDPGQKLNASDFTVIA